MAVFAAQYASAIARLTSGNSMQFQGAPWAAPGRFRSGALTVATVLRTMFNF